MLLSETAAPAPPAQRIRVIVADPDPMTSRFVRDELQKAPGLVVIATARDGVEAVELALFYRPEVVLIEQGMPGIDGTAATRRIVERNAGVRVIVFTTQVDHEVGMAALRAGASGYLSKDIDTTSLVRSVKAVAGGEAAISRALTLDLLHKVRRIPEAGVGVRPVHSSLTTREWEVLDLMTAGLTSHEIAASLGISKETVHSHTKNLMRKLDTHSRSEAIAAAGEICSRAA